MWRSNRADKPPCGPPPGEPARSGHHRRSMISGSALSGTRRHCALSSASKGRNPTLAAAATRP